jgi:hypothetical protein
MAVEYNVPVVKNGLVLYLDAANINSYPGAGTTWTDLSGNQNNAALTNGPTYSSANRGTIFFDGSDDSAIVTNNNGFGMSGSAPNISMDMWVNLPRRGFPFYQVAGFRNSSNFDFYILILDASGATANIEARIRTAGSQSDIPYVDYMSYYNKWTHLAFTVSPTISNLYINGKLVGSIGSIAGNLGATSGNFVVGNSQDNTWKTRGNMGSIRVYNRALSATEVIQNYDALKGRYGL